MKRRVIVMSGGQVLITESGAGTQRVHPGHCPSCRRTVTAADGDHDVHIPPGQEVSLTVRTCRVRPGPLNGVGFMTRRPGQG